MRQANPSYETPENPGVLGSVSQDCEAHESEKQKAGCSRKANDVDGTGTGCLIAA